MRFLLNFVAHELNHPYQGGDHKKGDSSAGGSNDRDPEVRSTVAGTRSISEWPCLLILRAYTLPQSPGEGLRQETSNVFIQRLGVATSRAFERRLGRPPSQADVCGVVNTLTGRSSRFLQCAERAQARLARLHSELQKSQEQRRGIDAAQKLTASSIASSKRPLEEPNHNLSDSPREVKRARLESGNPNPHKSPPPLKQEITAPSKPMAQKHAPIALQGALSDSQFVEAPRVDSTSSHARADFPTQTPVTAIRQPTSTDLSNSNSDHEIEQRTPSHNTVEVAGHGIRRHIEGHSRPARRESLPAGPFATQTPAQETSAMTQPSSAAASASGAQQSSLTILGTQTQHVIGSRTDLGLNSPVLPGCAAAVGLPVCTRPQAPPSASAPPLANVPGIWAIQVGKPSPCQIDLSFEVDQDTVVCIRRWATRRQGFE